MRTSICMFSPAQAAARVNQPLPPFSSQAGAGSAPDPTVGHLTDESHNVGSTINGRRKRGSSGE